MPLPLRTQQLLAGTLVLILTACAETPVKPEPVYSKNANAHLYKLDRWSFDGRLALASKQDSWSATINWQHQPDDEQIKLSGPLGQGAVLIHLTGDQVTVDRGDGQIQSSAEAERFIQQQLGLYVPVKSLRYWVVGLPEQAQTFTETREGFSQAGWLIEYLQSQAVKNETMPRKITVFNDKVKLKLIIDQWMLDASNVN